MALTLTTSEILLDVLDAFKKRVPAINRMGTDYRPQKLKKDQTYIAQIASVPTADDVTTTYDTTGQNARDMLVDVPVVASKHKCVKLKWSHFDAIKDNKNEYAKVIANAGYALAKAFVDDILASVTSVNFTQQSIFGHSDCDVDMLVDVTGDMNGVGAMGEGRAMIINSSAAGYLSLDSRLGSRDFQGQLPTGQAYRRWSNVYGFSEIIEYPDFPTNNGTAITSITAEADDEIFTKVAHGLVTGQRVALTAITGGTGLTQGSYYYVIRLSADTFYLTTTPALAYAGTPAAITSDGTSITITPNENLAAFAFDPRAIAVVAGIPADFDQGFLDGLGIPNIVSVDSVTDPETGLTMGAVGWQAVGTLAKYWAPTLVWGKSLGRQAGTGNVGAICDYAGHRIVTA